MLDVTGQSGTISMLLWYTGQLPQWTLADDRPEFSGSPVYNDSQRAHYIGDYCQGTCSAILQHAFCNMSSERCECRYNYPVVIDNLICEKPRRLDELCRYDRVCQFSDQNSECRSVSDSLAPRCRCRQQFNPTPFQTGSSQMYCIKDPLARLLEPDLSTALGLLVGLGAMAFLICMALRLFYRARHVRARGYGDANIPPPLSYTDVDVHHADHCSSESVRCSGEDLRHQRRTNSSLRCNGHAIRQPLVHHLNVEPDDRRLSGCSVNSSFSTCTYGLPESIATRIKAQKHRRSPHPPHQHRLALAMSEENVNPGPTRSKSDEFSSIY